MRCSQSNPRGYGGRKAHELTGTDLLLSYTSACLSLALFRSRCALCPASPRSPSTLSSSPAFRLCLYPSRCSAHWGESNLFRRTTHIACFTITANYLPIIHDQRRKTRAHDKPLSADLRNTHVSQIQRSHRGLADGAGRSAEPP